MYTRYFNEVEMVPYILKWVPRKEDADIVLSMRRDICDYFALGVFCLAKSIEKSDEKVVKVCYSYKEFAKPSGIVINVRKQNYPTFANPLTGQMGVNAKLIADHLFGKATVSAKTVLVIFAMEFTGVIMGVVNEPVIVRQIPKRYKMKDTMAAQEFAYKMICNKLTVP